MLKKYLATLLSISQSLRIPPLKLNIPEVSQVNDILYNLTTENLSEESIVEGVQLQASLLTNYFNRSDVRASFNVP